MSCGKSVIGSPDMIWKPLDDKVAPAANTISDFLLNIMPKCILNEKNLN